MGVIQDLFKIVDILFHTVARIAVDVRKFTAAIIALGAVLVVVLVALPQYRKRVHLPLAASSGASNLYFSTASLRVCAPVSDSLPPGRLQIMRHAGLNVQYSDVEGRTVPLGAGPGDEVTVLLPTGCLASLRVLEAEPGTPLLELRFSGTAPTLVTARSPAVKISVLSLYLSDATDSLLQVADYDALVRYIETSSEPLARFLRDRLHTAHPGPNDRTVVVDMLSRMVRRTQLYKSPLFEKMPLRQATLDLAERRPRGAALTMLNRMMLEDALPGVISMRAESESKILALDVAGQWACNLPVTAHRSSILMSDGTKFDLDPKACSVVSIQPHVTGQLYWDAGDQYGCRLKLTPFTDADVAGVAPTLLDEPIASGRLMWRDLLLRLAVAMTVVLVALRVIYRLGVDIGETAANKTG